MNLNRLRNRAFSLVELMIVVAIIGVLSTLAIQGVRRYLANAKTAEARNALGVLAKAATSSYDRESGDTALINLGSASAAVTHQFCATAGNTVPLAKASIAGKKYQSTPGDWSGDGTTGWRCLRFSIDTPQAFMYGYDGTATTFTATANGDLNGDGTLSTFTIVGKAESGVARYAPNIAEVSPDE
jgi:type IV pilus assembly protein PilA